MQTIQLHGFSYTGSRMMALIHNDAYWKRSLMQIIGLGVLAGFMCTCIKKCKRLAFTDISEPRLS